MYNLLENKRLILSLPLLLALSLFIPSHVAPSAHAAGFTGTGLVCITTSTTATNCSNSAPTIGPLTVGTTFTVGVFINNSQPMGGLDIFVRSDPSFVSPVSAALGTLIVSPTLTSICINGSAQTGSCTVGSANGPGVVEVTTIESSGSNECGGIPPCSGMAFTITYHVIGATPSTSLSYPTNAGCATSSVSSPANTCVLVSDNIGTTLPETIQGATVTISLPPAVVCITYPSTSTSCTTGAVNVAATFGSSYTVGVFVQSSAPMGGFDIYVQVDPNFLNPTSAVLGTLIASPSLTNICVNGATIQGQCSGPINGQGVVEVSTIESSGTNECPAAPCSGLAFTITYQVVGVTPSTPVSFPTDAKASGFCAPSSVSTPTPPPNTCVSVNDAFGPTLSESIQGAFVLQNHAIDPTSISKSCVAPATVFQPTTCTANVTDTALSGAIAPTGIVTWLTDASGVYQPVNTCTLSSLAPARPDTSTCSISYLPINVGSGTHHISVFYAGDSIHSGSNDAPFSLPVSPATPTLSASATVDVTGQPVSTGVLLGTSVHVVAVMIGGAPPQGVAGTVVYTLYPNSACTGTGTAFSTVNVRSADDVPVSGSVTPSPAGSYSISAHYNPATTDNNAVTSNCQPFTVGDYSLTAASASLSVQSGGSSQDIVTLTSLGPFTGGATLLHSAVPSGVTVQFVPNPVTITTAGGFATSTMAVFISPTVAAGTVFSFTVSVQGTTLHTVSISVTVIAGPVLVAGTLSFHHHLKLSKSGNTQTWTVTLNNPLTTSIKALIRVVGHSTTNPSRTFDVICGVTCVNTATGGVNSTPGLTPVTVAAGAVNFAFSFGQTISSSFVNQSVSFQVTLYFATGTVYGPSNSQSGSFKVSA